MLFDIDRRGRPADAQRQADDLDLFFRFNCLGCGVNQQLGQSHQRFGQLRIPDTVDSQGMLLDLYTTADEA
jgi:hypothetical protein